MLRADSGLSLQARATHAAMLEADIQVTLKLGISLHCRMTAKSPISTDAANITNGRCCDGFLVVLVSGRDKSAFILKPISTSMT